MQKYYIKTLNETSIKEFNYTTEDLIQVCNEDRYFILKKQGAKNNYEYRKIVKVM